MPNIKETLPILSILFLDKLKYPLPGQADAQKIEKRSKRESV